MAEIRVNANEIVGRFIAAWNADSETEARRHLEVACNEQTHFVSRAGESWGLSAQLAAIGEFRRKYPRGRCSGHLLAQHHRWLLVAWTLDFTNGEPPLTGVDAGLLDAVGRFVQIVSFSPVAAPSVAAAGAPALPSAPRRRAATPG